MAEHSIHVRALGAMIAEGTKQAKAEYAEANRCARLMRWAGAAEHRNRGAKALQSVKDAALEVNRLGLNEAVAAYLREIGFLGDDNSIKNNIEHNGASSVGGRVRYSGL